MSGRKGQNWTSAEIARLQALRMQGVKYADIAEILGRTMLSCQRQAERLARDGMRGFPYRERFEVLPVHRECRRQIAEAFGEPEHRLVGRARDRSVMLARKVAYFVLRERFGLSWVQVAEVMGGRDHSTCLSGVAHLKSMMARDKRLEVKVAELARGVVPRFFDEHVVLWEHFRWAESQNALRASREAAKAAREAAIKGELHAPIIRKVKPKNSLEDDDKDALRRMRGSRGLSAAIEAAGGWR